MGQQTHHVGEGVAEDPGHVAQRIDARTTAHLLERNELVPHDATGTLLHGPRASKLEDDPDGLALGLDRVQTPEVDADALGIRTVVRRRVLLEDGARDSRAAVAAAGEGMRSGSNAECCVRGRTPGPSRSKSPPTAGGTYSPRAP